MQSKIDQIYTLNNLLGLLAGSDLATTRELRRSIRFASLRLAEGASLASLNQCARELIKLHWSGRPAALLHCNLEGQDVEPLWLRSRVLACLQSIPATKDAVLLVSGMRESIAEKGSRWTRRRENEYSSKRAYLEDLCATERPFGVRLNVIFL